MKVIETGFIVCRINPWIGYTPDGVVFENGLPSKLIEVKCPYDGVTQTIDDVVRKQKWFIKTESGATLNEKHQYYGQVQLGMAVLNVKKNRFRGLFSIR